MGIRGKPSMALPSCEIKIITRHGFISYKFAFRILLCIWAVGILCTMYKPDSRNQLTGQCHPIAQPKIHKSGGMTLVVAVGVYSNTTI